MISYTDLKLGSRLLGSDDGCSLVSRDLDVVCSHGRNTSLVSTLVDEIGEHLFVSCGPTNVGSKAYLDGVQWPTS
jgi:hypothetical protein